MRRYEPIAKATTTMKCASCGGEDIRLVTGAEIYPRKPELYERKFWRCTCGAYVGCHSGTEQPYGTPANKELRHLRMRAHELFDPFWEKFGMTRTEAYAFLAERLRIPKAECHIGMFDTERCKRTIQVVQKYERYVQQVMKIGAATNFARFTGVFPDMTEEHDRDAWMHDLEEQFKHEEYEGECVLSGTCPKCGGPVRRTVDPRQAGPVELALEAGTWINYRCGRNPPIGVFGPRVCAWSGFDRKEPIGEN